MSTFTKCCITVVALSGLALGQTAPKDKQPAPKTPSSASANTGADAKTKNTNLTDVYVGAAEPASNGGAAATKKGSSTGGNMSGNHKDVMDAAADPAAGTNDRGPRQTTSLDATPNSHTKSADAVTVNPRSIPRQQSKDSAPGAQPAGSASTPAKPAPAKTKSDK